MRNATLALAATVLFVGCSTKHERVDPLTATAKACSGHAELECPRPIFNVRDLKASQRYYRDALGFNVDWEHGDPPTFGSVSRSDVILFMCQRCQSAPGAWLFTFTRDVDRLYKELVDRNAIIQLPPTNQPWGLREMQAADPDGNVLRFASPIDHDS